MLKNKKDAGADQLTPSLPQYFSWVNNTNEGSTEEQTMINLDFFDYLKRTYGMQIKIYAWDAGNFDGSREHYGATEKEKLSKQYPNGYAPIAERAKKAGIRLGLWGSPDGYGDDPETEKARYEFFVHLCRDYNFAEFKLDGVCGTLREEKAPLFAKMLRECREYSPDLVVLNHRLNLYEAEKHITTFLFNGDETYVDVLNCNNNTAMHNRAFMFTRGHVENLNRLAEDHGVCISSEIDYFEDELIYQAFGRCLILAPEIYGNPWLMRDDELAKLARVYNLHRRNASILVEGKLLPEEYGCHAISRGNAGKRFICTGNNSWESRKITVRLSELGLETDGKIAVNLHHPYEKHIGEFSINDTVEIVLMPFRATLIEAAEISKSEPMINGCEYEIINEDENGKSLKIKLFSGETDVEHINAEKEKAPRYLGALNEIEFNPENGEFLYEAASFAISNDSLEKRSLDRAGKTEIPEVQAARDAFFNQKTYVLRGCENANMFDGKPDTFFDAQSSNYRGEDLRIGGGCLRIDFGEEFNADCVEIECFAAKTACSEVLPFAVPTFAEYSVNLSDWKNTGFPCAEITDENYSQDIVRFTVHTIYTLEGRRIKITYPVGDAIRYLRIARPMDRIYSVKLIKNGKEISLSSPKANNMQAHYREKLIRLSKGASFVLPEISRPSKLAVAIDGKHGAEGVYCVAEVDGKTIGFPHRAPDYAANMWEHRVCKKDENYTYFLPVDESFSGKEIIVRAIFTDGEKAKIPCNVYLCDKH